MDSFWRTYIAGTGKNGRLLRDIQSGGIPVIQVVRQQENSISSVVADYESCGYEAVKYLAAKGCREIGLINGNMKLGPYQGRYQGYRRGLEELGLEETIASAETDFNTFAYGYDCTNALLEQNDALDGIMAAVDVQGMGAIRALKERGIKVPEEVRVISLTGHCVGEMLETTMTSLEMPAREMGEKATMMTVEAIEASAEQKPGTQHLVFHSILSERESG